MLTPHDIIDVATARKEKKNIKILIHTYIYMSYINSYIIYILGGLICIVYYRLFGLFLFKLHLNFSRSFIFMQTWTQQVAGIRSRGIEPIRLCRKLCRFTRNSSRTRFRSKVYFRWSRHVRHTARGVTHFCRVLYAQITISFLRMRLSVVMTLHVLL